MTTEIKKVTKSDLNAVVRRSNLFQGSWNFERMQALGFAYAMVPVIKRFYIRIQMARVAKKQLNAILSSLTPSHSSVHRF